MGWPEASRPNEAASYDSVLLLAGCAGSNTVIKPPLNLAAIGDSIFAGWLDPAGANVAGDAAIAALFHPDAANSFVGVAGKLAGANSVTYLGIAGTTAAQMTSVVSLFGVAGLPAPKFGRRLPPRRCRGGRSFALIQLHPLFTNSA
jgi:hypothetical protein